MASHDSGALARLFQINFAPSFHYPLQPYGNIYRTGTEVAPIAQQPGFRIQPGVGASMSYYGSIFDAGFQSAGATQTTQGGITGLVTTLGSIARRIIGAPVTAGNVSTAVGRTVSTAKGVQAPPTTPSGIAGAVQQHPIAAIAAAGGAAAATMGMTSTALRAIGIGGGHARYGSPGEKGYHMIKKGPHAGLWTRNRRRNVGNIRALRRALSRAHGFERICRKVMHFTHPGRSRGRAVFKRRRRRC